MTLNVLFLAAEADPFVKVGGLGDVAGALPDAIRNLSQNLPDSQKVDLRVVLPFHFAIKQKGYRPEYLGEFIVATLEEQVTCKVYHYDKEGLPIYFLDGKPIDKKSPVYSLEPIHDGYKFVFFSLASLQLAEFLNFKIDVLHANDWHTAASIYALHTLKDSLQFLKNTRTLLTLHNLPFMGFGVQKALSDYGLPPSQDESLPEWARHAPLPLGLLFADNIVAVSPNYAKEILTPEFGCGLENFLKTRKSVIKGIINGLDLEKWNPSIDPNIRQTYSVNDFSKRNQNKRDLQREYSLLQEQEVPLLTIVSRMDPQKGIDIALKGLRYCKDLPWQAIILGTGVPTFENMAVALEKEFPDRVRTIIDFDNKLAHQLYAGADIFMMPSRYEPCGLSQMISMRYGCVPVARMTGGLADTITNVSRKIDSGTGFLFDKPYPSAFAAALKRAIRFYQAPKLWQKIQHNGMLIDFSWEKPAQEYINTYYELVKNNL